MAPKRYREDRAPLDPSVIVSSGSNLTQSQILNRVHIDNRGCWIWPKVRSSGYANKEIYRRSYELWIGPIPKGAEVDHKCRVGACVNPAHLRLTNRSFNDHLREVAKRGQMSPRDLRISKWVHDELGRKLLADYGAEGSMT